MTKFDKLHGEGPAKRRSEGPIVMKLLGILKMAAQADRRLEITYKDRSEAMRARTGFYNAMRNVKNYPGDYPELVEVLEIVTIELRGNVLSIGRAELSEVVLGIEDQLAAQGFDLKPFLVPPKVAEVQASAKRMAERLAEAGMPAEGQGPGPGPSPSIDPDGLLSKVYKPNPYYRRESNEG